MFRLIKALIKKFLFYQCFIVLIMLMPTILFQNGGRQHYTDNVALNENTKKKKKKNLLDKDFDYPKLRVLFDE